jgi:large subunit ribosomal protein L9
MEVILLERVAKLGQMGEVVKVKDGYARNFLLPRHKALRATEANKQKFASQRAQLEANNLARKKDADAVAAKLDGQSFVLIRQAGESGVLYGSVSARDLAETMTAGGFTIARSQVSINAAIKTLGLHQVPVVLHPEVTVNVTINIARSAEEAERLARGENVFEREQDNLDDLGLEIGAALAEAGPNAEL